MCCLIILFQSNYPNTFVKVSFTKVFRATTLKGSIILENNEIVNLDRKRLYVGPTTT